MNNTNNPLRDKQFLKQLDNKNLQTYYVKIIVLNMQELPIEEITGRISSGSININGDSAIRRTCNLTFLAKEEENANLTNVNSLLSINKKIKILIGVKNDINERYDDIIWFPQGIYIICQPNISYGANGVTISLSCKDKMCLLNGECGGGLPAPITFDSYDQIQADGTVTSVPQTIYSIIQTLVANYGGEALSKIMINDVPLDIKQIVRYTGSNTLYYDAQTKVYTTNVNETVTRPNDWIPFGFNESIGYVYTDFVYPGSLQSGIGENVCSVLDKIKNTLGNYEYFYDLDGNFVFQEIKNYLNKSYSPVDIYRLDNNRRVEIASNNLTILDNLSYKADFHSNSKTAYDFTEDTGLISSYTNTPVYSNIKNDFHIWGKNEDGFAIHYHLVIKDKPLKMNTYNVVFLKDESNKYTGGLRLATKDEIEQYSSYNLNREILTDLADGNLVNGQTETYINNDNIVSVNVAEETIILPEDITAYVPSDWRAELYLQALTKKSNGIRPDIYEQELLDLFDSIYNFYERKFKADLVNNPNDLNYFIDYLKPSSELFDISVDSLYPRIYSYQQDNIVRLYNNDVPDVILIDKGMEDQIERIKIQTRCENEGQIFSNVESAIYANTATSVLGYSAQDSARELLYQYTHYNETITLQSRPIYYLDANTRITVNDIKSGISGDYIVKSISLPLDAGSSMSINATKAVDRI